MSNPFDPLKFVPGSQWRPKGRSGSGKVPPSSAVYTVEWRDDAHKYVKFRINNPGSASKRAVSRPLSFETVKAYGFTPYEPPKPPEVKARQLSIVTRADGTERRRTTVYLSPETARALAIYCAEHDCDMSDVVESVTADFLTHPRPKEAAQ